MSSNGVGPYGDKDDWAVFMQKVGSYLTNYYHSFSLGSYLTIIVSHWIACSYIPYFLSQIFEFRSYYDPF